MSGRQLELGGGACLVVRAPAFRPAFTRPAAEVELPTRSVRTIHDSPLWTGEHSLYGRIPTHPLELEAIAARVAAIRRRETRPRLVLTPYVGALLVVSVQPWLAYLVLLALLVYVTRKATP